MKKLRWILPSGVLLILALIVVLGLSSPLGLKLLQRVANGSGGALHIGSVAGAIAGDWMISDLELKTSATLIRVNRIHSSWNLYQLLRGRLKIFSFTVSGVNIHFLPHSPAATKQEAKGGASLPFFLPRSISVKKWLCEDVRLTDDKGEIYTFDRFGGEVDGAGSLLHLRELFLYSENLDFTIAGSVAPEQNWKLDIGGKIRFVGYGFHQLTSTFTADGPMEAPHLLMDVNAPVRIKFDGRARHLFSSPAYTVLFTGKDVDLSAFIRHCPQIVLHEVHGDTYGDTAGYGGLVTAIGDWGHSTGMHFTSRLQGGMWGIDFNQLEITRKDGKAVAKDAKISWRKLFSWEGGFDFSKFDLETVAPGLSGKLSAKFTSAGDVNHHGLDVTFAVDSLDGDFMGRPVAAKGMLYLNEAGIRSDNITLKSGEVEGMARLEQGAFSWVKTMPWNVRLKLSGFNPEGIHANLPGHVNGQLEAEGEWTAHGLQGKLAIRNLSGELRGNPLLGGGEINFREGSLQSSGLSLESGGSKLTVSGETGERLALEARLNLPDVSVFIPDAKGRLDIAGKIGGTFAAPQLDFSLDGGGLRWGAAQFSQITAKLQNDRAQLAQWRATIQSGEYSLGAAIAGKNAMFSGVGTLASHKLSLLSNGSFGSLKAIASGSYVDGQLTGQLTTLELLSSRYGAWRENSPAGYSYGNEKIGLEGFCISESGSQICFSGTADNARTWRIDARIDDISMAWLSRWGLLGYPVTGTVHGQLKAEGRGDELVFAEGELHLPETDFQLSSEGDTPLHLLFDDTAVTLNAGNGMAQATLTAASQSGGSIQVAASVYGVRRLSAPFSSLGINGNIELKDFDLSVLSGISSSLMEPTGRANSTFELSGTIGEPSVQGQLNIAGGGIELPYQGITLEDVNLSLGAEDHGVKVVCTARSGPGKVTSTGVIHYRTEGVSGVLNISGDEFLVVDLPEYAIRVNPALKFSFAGTKATVTGNVFVPYGRITPEEITNSVTVSEDAVLIEEDNTIKASGWPLTLNMGVTLGDDVRIDGYGLKGLINGRLRLRTSPDEQLTGNGEMSLKDGAFTIYGRSLDIVRGRLLFTGGAVDNPGVDVRAQKKVSDEEAKGQGYTVGVDISGLVQDLQYHLFSDPSMDDTEIVSRMLVGHSFADSNAEEGGLLKKALVTLGVHGNNVLFDGLGSILTVDDMHLEGSQTKEDTSLVVGKRLTEDLYIGYDVNMFSQLGSFRVRYDLKHGFVVETTSSSEATGADLMYSFQR